MTWDILILTQPSRYEFLQQLSSILGPQIRYRSDVAILMKMFDRKLSLGENREELRKLSRADYICFVDDDDLVSKDYVDKILPLLDGIDQIGFEVACWQDQTRLKRDFHKLSSGGWFENDKGLFRDISHLNPMRRELAMEVPMSGGVGEDFRWAAAMRGRVKSEHYVDAVLYHYFWRTNKRDAVDARSVWRQQRLAEIAL